MSDARSYLRTARDLIKQGQPNAAADLLAIAHALAPQDDDVTSALADSHYRAGRPNEATALWRTIAARTPESGQKRLRVHLKLARAALAGGHVLDAIGHLANQVRVEPGDVRSAAQLLALRLDSAPPPQRRMVAQAHLDEVGGHGLDDLVLAIHLDRHEAPAKAAQTILADPQRFAENPDLALAAADALIEVAPADAAPFLSAIEPLFPGDSRFVRKRAQALAAAGAGRRTVAAAADALSAPGGRDRLVKMRLLAGLRDWDGVVTEAEAMLGDGAFEPGAAALALRAGIALERDDLLDRFLARAAASLGSGTPDATLALARLELAAGRPAAAAGRLAPLHATDATRASARSDLARAHLAMGRYEEAWTPLSEALDAMQADDLRLRRLAARCGAALASVPDPAAPFPEALFAEALKVRPGEPAAHSPGLVAIVTSTLAAGGAERQVALTAAGIAARRAASGARTVLLGGDLDLARGNAVMLDLARHPGLEIEQTATLDPVLAFRDLCARRAADPRTLRLMAAFPESLSREIVRLYARFLALRPEVVHLWQDGRISVGSVAAVLAGVPRIVASVRNMAPPVNDRRRNRPFLPALYRALQARPDVTLTGNSAAGAADYERAFGLPDGSIAVLRNGIDVAQVRVRAPAAAVAAVRARLGVPKGGRLVGGVFRLAPAKRPDLWLETARLVAPTSPDTRFVVVGEGVLRTGLERKAARLGLSEKLVFAGPQDPVEPWIAAMDVMLLTSAVEGLPNVVLEAQALGVAVVATEAGGVGEAFLDGRTGRLVAQAGAESLAAAIGDLLDRPAALQEAREAGPAFAAARFGLDRMIDETLAAYRF